MELRGQLDLLRRWLWLIVLGAVIAGSMSYAVTRTLPKVYMASTTVMIGQEIYKKNPDPGSNVIINQLANSYAELARRKPILEATIEALKIPHTPASLADQVMVRVVTGTQLMEIRAKDTNSVRAAQIANEVARQLILQSPTAEQKQNEAKRQFVQVQLEDLQSKIEGGKATLIELDNSLSTTTSAAELADIRNRMNILQLQMDNWQKNYATLLSSVDPGATNYLTIIEPATVPAYPVSPNTYLNVLLAVVVGVALAGGTVLLLDYFDDTIRTSDDIARRAKSRTLATVPNLRRGNKDYGAGLVTVENPASEAANAFRFLRSQLHLAKVVNPHLTLLVTSPKRGEGRSMTVANLAVSMARFGQKVVAVDADLRHPSLHEFFNVHNDKGLGDYLIGMVSNAAEITKPTTEEGLWVIPGGFAGGSSLDLLGSARMKDLVESLLQRADVVLLDSSPMEENPDTLLMASGVRGVLLVCEAERSQSSSLLGAVESLEKVEANILGVVLNGAKK